jgi:subtilisin family serine protease
VLNPYGVGCVETIAQGLLNVLRNPDIQRPLIVNCSLVLDLPGEGEAFPDFPAPLADPATLKHMRQPLEEILGLLMQGNAVIVAAAGNDASRSAGNPSTGRPPARYPAAFADVIGVGAVSNQVPSKGKPFQAASYSNLADEPAEAGYVTLGGESGKDQGMLGLFTSGYPNPADKGQADPHAIGYLKNESGWARWAGTSFATPVVSGILAAWWDTSLGQATTAARTILDRAVSGATDQNEKVIFVKQQ